MLNRPAYACEIHVRKHGHKESRQSSWQISQGGLSLLVFFGVVLIEEALDAKQIQETNKTNKTNIKSETNKTNKLEI
jgi:hypothetical protein